MHVISQVAQRKTVQNSLHFAAVTLMLHYLTFLQSIDHYKHKIYVATANEHNCLYWGLQECYWSYEFNLDKLNKSLSV